MFLISSMYPSRLLAVIKCQYKVHCVIQFKYLSTIFPTETQPQLCSPPSTATDLRPPLIAAHRSSCRRPISTDLPKISSKKEAMAAPDHLFSLRNNFYIGAYQAAINNSHIDNLSSDDAVERDCLVYRSYIALGSYQLVINEIDNSAPTPLQAVKLLALYLSSHANKESTISSLKRWLADSAIGNNAIVRLIAGTIFMHEEDYNEALKHTYAGGTMELHALNVKIFREMHRLDYAEKQLRYMQQIDEDHILTQLANAWLNLAVGGSKLQEAYLIFQDFSEKYPMTCLILNEKAVCCMLMGNFDEAETLLLEALNKDAKDTETLAYLVVYSLYLDKPAMRYISQLKLLHSDHMLVKRSSAAEDNFERALQSVA